MNSSRKHTVNHQKPRNIFEKVLHAKRVLNECIRNGGNLTEVAKKHDIKLATPV